MYTVETVRERAIHSLSPEVAHRASMTLAELQQFTAFMYLPSDAQLHQLAIRTGLYPDPSVGVPVTIWPKYCGVPRPAVGFSRPSPIYGPPLP
jgi:hypothetical protein